MMAFDVVEDVKNVDEVGRDVGDDANNEGNQDDGIDNDVDDEYHDVDRTRSSR